MNEKQAIEKIKQTLNILSDNKDEYLYWSEDDIKKNYLELVESFEAVLKGQKSMLEKISFAKKMRR